MNFLFRYHANHTPAEQALRGNKPRTGTRLSTFRRIFHATTPANCRPTPKHLMVVRSMTFKCLLD
jgi:hypothetical protein